jgi:hypothetical protein
LNKKYAIVSIVLIALMSLSLIPMGAFAFHSPSSTDDHQYDQFGPRPSQLLITIYTDYAASLAGFKNKEFDVMDWGLNPIDYQWFEENDPNHAQYSTAFYAEFGLFEYDTQDQVLPTSIVSFRQAISYMLDKDYFIGVNLPNSAAKADSPIASITGWYNPALTDLYNIQPRTTMLPLPDDPADWLAAYQLLEQDLGTPFPDPESPGYYTWTWPSPFPTPDPMGLVGPVPDGHLLVFARSDSSPERLAQGQFLKDCLETALPAMTVALGLVPGLGAKIHVDLNNVGRPVTSVTVMQEYWFHYYTGGWSLSRDPDFLQYYQTAQITKPLINAHNYPCYSNPNYDAEVDAMMSSSMIGSEFNPSDGKYHAYVAQQIFMSEAGIVPMWTYAGYKAVLANWRGVVNQIGFGLNSWWTFLNGHKVGSQCGDVIRYGWQGDLVSLNVIGATWLWDWEAMNKIYDSLIAVNPYNMAEDISYITNGWTISTWAGPGGTDTMLSFNIRQDVWWQDVPFHDRTDKTFDHGTEIDGPFQNYQLTPIDVAFSFVYQRDNAGANAAYLMDNLDHVEMNPMWAALWPYNCAVPEWFNTGHPEDWQRNFVQYDSSLASNQIVVKLSTFMPWLGLHRIGGVPLIPMHIWRAIPMIGSESIDTWGNDIVYGTGPYILLTRNPGVSMVMIPYIAGASYRGVTTQNSYFYQPIRPTPTPSICPIYKGINGYSLYYGAILTNFDHLHGYSIVFYFSFDIYIWTGTAWSLVSEGITLPKLTTISAGGTVYAEDEVYLLPSTGPNKVQWGTLIEISFDFHWSYLYDATLTGNVNLFADTEIIVHPGDVAGYTPTPAAGGYWPTPHIAADGKCDIKDVSVIGANWQATVDPSTFVIKNDANNARRRADINNDLKIDIKDVSIIGANWQKTWGATLTISANVTGGLPPLGVRFTDLPAGATVYNWLIYGPGHYAKINPLIWVQTAGNTFDYQFTQVGVYWVINIAVYGGVTRVSARIVIVVDP